jgi:pyruvate,water dikinase
MHDVKAGAMTFEDFIRQYGLRADKDYELSCPRWLEIPEQIKLRIKDLGELTEISRSKKTDTLPPLAQTVVELQLARIRIKQKALAYMYHLRLELLSKYKKDDLAEYTRSLILFGKNESIVSEHINIDEQVIHKTVKDAGKGNGVSQGIGNGVTQHINDATETIHEGAICIFPNTSPEFSPFYKKCNAIIFMKGGVTSHGAIVAREYGIPAIVYNQTEEIPQNTAVEVDGMKGTWKVV